MKKIFKIIGIISVFILAFLCVSFFYKKTTIVCGETSIIGKPFYITGEFYSKNSCNVFYEVIAGRGCDNCSDYDKKQKISGADPDTFEVLNSHYVKDKNSFFVCTWTGADLFRISTRCKKIKNIDYASFEIINNDPYGDYAKDKNYIYYDGIIIKNADYYSFKVFDYKHAKDKNNCYEYGEVVSMLECENFEK